MRTIVVALLAGFLLVPTGTTAYAGPATAARGDEGKTCQAPVYPSAQRNGDFEGKVKARLMSCADAAALMIKHYECRIANGANGRCVKKVQGFGCIEYRTPDYDNPTTYSSLVTCTKNKKKLKFGYWQNHDLVRATTCTAPAYPATDGSFNLEVKASKLSCAKAAKVMLKHYDCRTEARPEGRCVHRINKGFACLEERYSDFYAPDYQASVTCKRDRKKVVFGYNQTKYDS